MNITAVDIGIFAGFVFSIVVHECAHAVVASWCGDDTARLLGRITLNPIPHIDPVMSILLPGLLLAAGAPVFGGAKPVPVNMMNLKHPFRDMMWIALAGPISNILLAILFALLLNLVPVFRDSNPAFANNLGAMLWGVCQVNLLLALFNMIPIPPLDGSRVLAVLLPRPMGEAIYTHQAQTIGMLMVMGLVYTGGTRFLSPVLVHMAVALLKVTAFTWTPILP